ncbi:MAG: rod shape-determining protein MreD [Bacteroidaceae bacterium]|nr:rod shape-determining protein MreD [Bacteroidaceae bacterium]
MSSIYLSRLFRLLILLFFQVLVFNHIHLLGYITPLVMGYMIVCFRRNASRISILIWGFITGLLFDIFSNTAGMASASCTLIAMVQPLILNMLSPRDAADDFKPSYLTLGFWNYTFYTFLLMLILHGTFYLLDAFTLADWLLTCTAILGSSVLTTILIIFIELLVHSRQKKKHHA